MSRVRLEECERNSCQVKLDWTFFFEKLKIRALQFIILLINCTLGSPNCTIGPPNLGGQRVGLWVAGPLDPLMLFLGDFLAGGRDSGIFTNSCTATMHGTNDQGGGDQILENLAKCRSYLHVEGTSLVGVIHVWRGHSHGGFTHMWGKYVGNHMEKCVKMCMKNMCEKQGENVWKT